MPFHNFKLDEISLLWAPYLTEKTCLQPSLRKLHVSEQKAFGHKLPHLFLLGPCWYAGGFRLHLRMRVPMDYKGTQVPNKASDFTARTGT